MCVCVCVCVCVSMGVCVNIVPDFSSQYPASIAIILSPVSTSGLCELYQLSQFLCLAVMSVPSESCTQLIIESEIVPTGQVTQTPISHLFNRHPSFLAEHTHIPQYWSQFSENISSCLRHHRLCHETSQITIPLGHCVACRMSSLSPYSVCATVYTCTLQLFHSHILILQCESCIDWRVGVDVCTCWQLVKIKKVPVRNIGLVVKQVSHVELCVMMVQCVGANGSLHNETTFLFCLRQYMLPLRIPYNTRGISPLPCGVTLCGVTSFQLYSKCNNRPSVETGTFSHWVSRYWLVCFGTAKLSIQKVSFLLTSSYDSCGYDNYGTYTMT